MRKNPILFSILALAPLTAASCSDTNSGDSATPPPPAAVQAGQAFDAGEPVDGNFGPFAVTSHAVLDQPFALAIEPGTGTLFITEKPGTMKFLRADGTLGSVTGLPEVDHDPRGSDQGGLGDFAFAPDYAESGRVYLSWAEAGVEGKRGAALARATLTCEAASCALKDLNIIWRQSLKVDSRGHYSHKIAFSPDGEYLFVSSGDRQQGEPAQDLSNNLGTIVRLTLDGKPAPANPFTDTPRAMPEIWTYGHRNVLGLQFAPDGRLWDLEHGPAGGDELNLVKPGQNYGWPLVSDGDHYDGRKIPNHDTAPQYAAPAISWNPVIAPGDFLFYTGDAFPDMKGDALMTGLGTRSLVQVRIDGESAREIARFAFPNRLRDIAQASDGTLWMVEDGPDARLLRLVPTMAPKP